MRKKFAILSCCLLFFFIIDLAFGSVSIPLKELFSFLTPQNANGSIYYEIIYNHRLPKAITAITVGSALAAAGLLMQTLFHNPLAGPDVLGITSGASLGVAILTMGGAVLPMWLIGSWGQIAAATLGGIGLLLLIVLISSRIKQNVSLLIIGMMFGFFTSALVSILQSISNPDSLKLFISWTFGSLSAVSWEQLGILTPIVTLGLLLSIVLQKKLNIFLLGENYAKGLGLSTKKIRTFLILLTGLLAGTSTAFTGPIAFIGITVPHLARGLFKSNNHKIVLPASMLIGASLMLLCDTISQLPGMQGTLPINSVTALFGAPLIIWIITKKRKS